MIKTLKNKMSECIKWIMKNELKLQFKLNIKGLKRKKKRDNQKVQKSSSQQLTYGMKETRDCPRAWLGMHF
jgi:hypothetical protein